MAIELVDDNGIGSPTVIKVIAREVEARTPSTE